MKLKSPVVSDFINGLIKSKTVVKLNFYLPNDRHATHFFKGIITSATDRSLALYDDRTGNMISVADKDIVVLSALKVKQPLYPAERCGQGNKKPYHQKFSYAKWWKNEKVEEVEDK